MPKNLGDCLKQKGWTSTYGYHKALLSNIKKGDVTKILSWFDENQNKAIIISEIIRHISSIED